MKKLYYVERAFYVMAEDEGEAESYQPRDPLSCTNFAYETDIAYAEWAHAIPFEGEDDKTVSQIIREEKDAKTER